MRVILKPLVLGCLLAGLPAWAEDRALVIGNDYADPVNRVNVGSETTRAVRGLANADFTVLDGRNLATDGLRARLARLLRDLRPTDYVVILLAGDFAHSQGQTWFLPPDAADTADLHLASIGEYALNVTTVLEVASIATGRAVVVLGNDDGQRLPLGTGLEPGLGTLDIPQGVAVVTGGAAEVSRFAANALSNRGQSLAQMLNATRNVQGMGYLPASTPFRPVAAQPATTPPAPAPKDDSLGGQQAVEAADWAATQKAGTIAAYEKYLQDHPGSRNFVRAMSELNRLRNDPTLLAQQAEEALSLNRDQRRTVQRQLTLLGFDTRGIDGIFGRGTRGAITAWQKSQGAVETGYLSAFDMQRIGAQADRRAAELEAEAAARQAELERQDRLFWQQTGAVGDEAGLRAYLAKYPDGLFADPATTQLDAIEATRRAQAAEQDRNAWTTAEAQNTVAGYREYLRVFPQGAFAPEAQARIDAAQSGNNEARAAAEAAERQLNLNFLTQRLIEERLAGLGFDPGPTDGQFDDATRRAIRRFQNARGQPVTGYIDQAAIVALLAGGIGGILKLGE